MVRQKKSANTANKNGMQGFSMIELLIVLAVIAIMTGVSLFYLTAHQELYEADDQALKIIDVLQEARQRSLTQRETMRVQIDLTDNLVRLIDENRAGTIGATDDTIIRTVPLLASEKVVVERRPDNVSGNPPEPMPVPSAQFNQSIYPTSQNNDVATIRFQSDGTVVDEGTNAAGTAGTVSAGVTLHVWSPADNNDSDSKIARAITVLGSSGTIRLWLYDPEPQSGSEHWLDSRRTSSYGGTGSQ